MDTHKVYKEEQMLRILFKIAAGLLFVWLCFIICALPAQAADEAGEEMIFYAEDGPVIVEDDDYLEFYRITQGEQVHRLVPRAKTLVLESRTPGAQEKALKSGFDVKVARQGSPIELCYRNVTLKGQALRTHAPIQVHAVTEGTYGCIFLADKGDTENELVSPVLVEGDASVTLEAKSKLFFNEPEDLGAKLLWIKEGTVVIEAKENIRFTGGSTDALIYQEKGTLEFRGSKSIVLTGRNTKGWASGIFSPDITFAEGSNVTIWNMVDGIKDYRSPGFSDTARAYLRGSGHLLIHTTMNGIVGAVRIDKSMQLEIYARDDAIVQWSPSYSDIPDSLFHLGFYDLDETFSGDIYVEDVATGQKKAYKVKEHEYFVVRSIVLPGNPEKKERIWLGDDVYLAARAMHYDEVHSTAYIPKCIPEESMVKVDKVPLAKYNIKDIPEDIRGAIRERFQHPSPSHYSVTCYALSDKTGIKEDIDIPFGGVVVLYQDKDDKKIYDRNLDFGYNKKYYDNNQLDGPTVQLENVKIKGRLSNEVKGLVVEIPDGTSSEINGDFSTKSLNAEFDNTMTVQGGGNLTVNEGAPCALSLEKGLTMTINNDQEGSYACSDITIKDASLIVHSNGAFNEYSPDKALKNKLHLLDEKSYLEYHAGAAVSGYCFNGDIDWRNGKVRAYLGNNSNWIISDPYTPVHIDKDVDIQCFTTANGTNPATTETPFDYWKLDGTGGRFLFHRFNAQFDEDTLIVVTNVNDPADIRTFKVPKGSREYILPADAGATYEITGGGKVIRDDKGNEQFTIPSEGKQQWVDVALDENEFNLADGNVTIEKLNDDMNKIHYGDKLSTIVDKRHSISIFGAGTEYNNAITHKVVVDSDVKVNIVLKDWRRSQKNVPVDGPAIELKDRADARIILAEDKVNLECADSPAILVPESATLTLAPLGTGHKFTTKGTGSPAIGAKSGNRSGTVNIIGTGELYVEGGESAASIGGGQNGEAGAITVGGKVKLRVKAGKGAPAIGGGPGREASGTLTVGPAAELVAYTDSKNINPVTAEITERGQSLAALTFNNPVEDAKDNFRYRIYQPDGEKPDQAIRAFELPSTATSAVVSLDRKVENNYTVFRSQYPSHWPEIGLTKEGTMLTQAVNPGAEGVNIIPTAVTFEEPEIKMDDQVKNIVKRNGITQVSKGEETPYLYLPETAFEGKEVDIWLSGKGDTAGIVVQDGYTENKPLILRSKKVNVNTGENSAFRIMGSSWVTLYFDKTEETDFRLENNGTLPAIHMDSGTGFEVKGGDKKNFFARGVLGGMLDLYTADMNYSMYGSPTGAFTAIDVETLRAKRGEATPFRAYGYSEVPAFRGNIEDHKGKGLSGVYTLNHVLNAPVTGKQRVQWNIVPDTGTFSPEWKKSEIELLEGMQSYMEIVLSLPPEVKPEEPYYYKSINDGQHLLLLEADTKEDKTALAWANKSEPPVTRMIMAENTDKFDIKDQDIQIKAYDKDRVIINFKDAKGYDRTAILPNSKPVTILQPGTENTAHRLEIIDTPANIVLKGVNLQTEKSPVSIVANDPNGNNEVKITLEEKSTLNAGKNHAAIEVQKGATLTITGDQNKPDTTSLAVRGGENAAGIGSSANMIGGNVFIEGGSILAYGGTGGAGIGGSLDGIFGKTTISGGTVKAYGGAGASGIGCGTQRYCGDIVIENERKGTSGTIVRATGGNQGAGISTSRQQEAGTIDIKDSVELAAVSDGSYPAINGMEDTLFEAYVLNHKLQTETEEDLVLKITNPDNTYNSEQITIPAGYRNYALTLPNSEKYIIKSAKDDEYLIRDASGQDTFTGTHQAKAVDVWLLSNLAEKKPVISNLAPAVEDELTASIEGSKPLGDETVYKWYTVDEKDNEILVQEGTQSTYEVKAVDYGKKIGVKIEADESDQYYTGVTKMSALTEKTAKKELTGTVTIEGIPEIRETLTAKVEGFTKKDGSQAELSYKWTDQFGRDVKGITDERQYVLPETDGAIYKVTVTVSEKGYSGEAVSELSPAAVKIAVGGFVKILVEGTDDEATTDNATPGVTLKADISGMIPEGIPESELRYLWFSGTGDRQVSNLELLNRGNLRQDTCLLTGKEVGRTIHLMVKGAGELYQGFLLSEGTSIGAQQVTGSVRIDGTVKAGETLTAVPDFGTEITEFAYTWTYEGDTTVLGTEQTYVIGPDDVGKKISVKAVVTQQGYTGTAEAVTEEAVPDIEAESVSPAILKDGQPVAADTPIYPRDVLSWDKGTVPEADIVAHEWTVGSSVSYDSAYTVKASDIGKQITLTVIVDQGKYKGNPSFTTAAVTIKPQSQAKSGHSSYTEAVWYASNTEKKIKSGTVDTKKAGGTSSRLMGTVHVEGVRIPGETLTAVPAGFTKPDGEAPDMGYVWFVGDGDGTAEKDEFVGLGSTYTVQETDDADKIQVMAAVKDKQYRGYAVSTNVQLTGEVKITKNPDTLATETLLTADISGLNKEASGNVQYQWKRETDEGTYTDIPSAQGYQYRLTPEDVGHKIGVTVTGINNLIGSKEAFTEDAVSVKKLNGAITVTGDAFTGGVLTAKADFDRLLDQTSPAVSYEWKDGAGNVIGNEAAITVPEGMEGKRLSVAAFVTSPGYEGSIEGTSDVIKKAPQEAGKDPGKTPGGKGTDTSGENIWNRNKGGFARTGDPADIALYVLLAAAGAGGIIYGYRRKKKQR